MAGTRISTTVDVELLAGARRARDAATDAELIARLRSAEIDEAYAAAYTEHAIDEADEWGDPASFRAAAAST